MYVFQIITTVAAAAMRCYHGGAAGPVAMSQGPPPPLLVVGLGPLPQGPAGGDEAVYQLGSGTSGDWRVMSGNECGCTH